MSASYRPSQQGADITTIGRICLDRGVCPSMAWAAKSYEVFKVIGFQVVVKLPERNNVMRVGADVAAMLAKVPVSSFALPLLRRPVRAAMMNRSSEILRMVGLNTVQISTRSCAKLSDSFGTARGFTGKIRPATHTFKPHNLLRARSCSRVLAGGRTRLGATMFGPTRYEPEQLPAGLTVVVGHSKNIGQA